MGNFSTDDEVAKELKATENLKALEIYKTEMKKVQFINEIKNGLGMEIKTNPSKVRIIKKTWYQKLGTSLKKLFTKF